MTFSTACGSWEAAFCGSSSRGFEEETGASSSGKSGLALWEPVAHRGFSLRAGVLLTLAVLLQKSLSAHDLCSLSLAVLLFCLSFVHG